MKLNDTQDIIKRLRNPLMLRKGDYDRAADMIEQLQRDLAEAKAEQGRQTSKLA